MQPTFSLARPFIERDVAAAGRDIGAVFGDWSINLSCLR